MFKTSIALARPRSPSPGNSGAKDCGEHCQAAGAIAQVLKHRRGPAKTKGELDEPTYDVRRDRVGSALAQQPSPSRVTLLCKTSLGGSGFAFVTLSNLTTATHSQRANTLCHEGK